MLCKAYNLNTLGCGVVFRLANTTSGWVEKVLHVFNGMDGAELQGGVTFDQAGNMYGAAWEGGTGGGIAGGGSIYELTRSRSGWIEKTLYNFPGTLGRPVGELVLDAFDNIYGATEFDGLYGYGSVFELSASGDVSNVTTLHSFTGLSDGWFPTAGIVFDDKGNIFGTTSGSLTGICNLGCGLVYMLDKSNGWEETVLHSFQGPDGALPWARLLLRDDGIYGTTYVGGVDRVCLDANYPGCGTVFTIHP
jgi:hypothetical protein